MEIINYQDARPIYEQIADSFELQILKGILQKDEQMPSVRSLAIELSTNPNTVQKAYTYLENQGYIYTVKGRGNFVNGSEHLMEKKKEEIVIEIRRIIEEAEEIGIRRDELLKEIQK